MMNIKSNPEEFKNRHTLIEFKQINENNYETNIYNIWLTPKWNQLTIARKDNMPVESWYDMWNIKNSIWGEECLAIEIYPPKSNLIDGQNQRHLFKIKIDKCVDFSNASQFRLL